MLDVTKSLPKNPAELRVFTALLLAEVKSQAVLIEKLRHQLAGRRAHRFGASSETSEQLQSALETTEIAIAAMTAKRHPPEDVQADKPKRRPVPDRIPRLKVEPTPAGAECAQCGGKLRRLGEDATEERECVPGPSPPPLGLNQWRTNGGSSNQWRTMARYREPDRPPAFRLFLLRAVLPSPVTIAPDRARAARSGPACACAGQRMRRSLAALSPKPDLRPRRP